MRAGTMLFLGLTLPVTCGSVSGAIRNRDVSVDSLPKLRAALNAAKAGDTIRIAPGEYANARISLANVHGAPGRPITICGADPKNPPIFRGGNEGLHLSSAEHVELTDLVFIGPQDNGINIDDGGTMTRPSHHITLRRITVRDMPIAGNHEGIKLSGLEDFRVEDCTIERWGTAGGQGIDMVGCHRGVIENSTFRHLPDEEQGVGVQIKGGSRDITIRRCRFEDAGGRGVNAGGSTGFPYFRPALDRSVRTNYEAKNVTVEGCTFLGGVAPVACVGVDGATIRFNTIYHPRKWALRILQETRAADFVASRNGVFRDNLILFRSDSWAEGGVNIGPGTAPQTFTFARNVWYCEDAPARSQPKLPVAEANGIYGIDPQLTDPEHGNLRLRTGSPAARVGASAFPGR